MSRYAEIDQLRKSPMATWCGVCLETLDDDTVYSHACSNLRPEITDADRLTLTDMKGRFRVRRVIDGEPMRLSVWRPNKKGDLCTQVATRWEPGHFGGTHEFQVRKDEPLQVVTDEGVELVRNMTQAEVNALEVWSEMQGSGVRVDIIVRASNGHVNTSVFVRPSKSWENNYSIGWATGRRTSTGRTVTYQTAVLEHRTHRVGRQRSYTARITGSQFKRALHDLVRYSKKEI